MNTNSIPIKKALKIKDKILTEANTAIENYEQNTREYLLFDFDREYDRDFSEMLKSLMFDKKLIRFFRMLLVKNTLAEGIVLPTRSEMGEFLYFFFSDIKMYLLKDAMIRLSNYFVKNIDSKKYLELKYELFYKSDEFKKEIISFVTKSKLADKAGIINVVNEYEKIIHCKVPKICFPWYAYALCHTFADFPSRESKKNFYIVNGLHLSLNPIGRNKFPDMGEYLEGAHNKFSAFLNTIESKGESLYRPTYNRSLNLFLFNELTNLYDLINIVGVFRDRSYYMKYQVSRMEIGINTINKEMERDRNIWKKEILDGVSHIAELGTLGVKNLLIDNYYKKELFTDKRTWITLKRIMMYCKKYLLEVLKEHHLSEFENLPEEIQLDYCIYSLLHKEEPYTSFLNDPLEIVPADVDESEDHEKEIVITPSPKEIYLHLNEAYFYAHKGFYEVRFKGKKLQGFEKY